MYQVLLRWRKLKFFGLISKNLNLKMVKSISSIIFPGLENLKKKCTKPVFLACPKSQMPQKLWYLSSTQINESIKTNTQIKKHLCHKIDYNWQYLISQNDYLQYKNKVLTALLDQHNFLYHFEKLLFCLMAYRKKWNPGPSSRTLEPGS